MAKPKYFRRRPKSDNNDEASSREGRDDNNNASAQKGKVRKFSTLKNTLDSQVATYKNTYERLLTYLEQNATFQQPEEVVESITLGGTIMIAPPTLDVARADDPNRDELNASYRETHRDGMKEHRERVRLLDRDVRRTYHVIFDKFCDKHMQRKLRDREDFEATLKNDPIETLNAIKELMHSASTEKLVYHMATLWQTLAQLFTITQGKS